MTQRRNLVLEVFLYKDFMNYMNYNPTTVQVAEEKSTTVEAERKSKDKNN